MAFREPLYTFSLLVVLYPPVTELFQCPDNVTIGFQDRKPFAGQNNSEATGVVYTGLTNLLGRCCDTKPLLIHLDLTYSLHSFMENNASVLLPVGRDDLQLQAFGCNIPLHGFLPIVHSSGVIYLIQNREREEQNQIFVNIVEGGWPFLVVIVLVALYGGFIVWALETRWNECQFPTPCPRGVWEGLWMSVITMTTVGYGDRTPRTVLGRLFVMIYILIGTIIVSLLTAAITAVVTSETDAPNLLDKEVAVLKDSSSYHLARLQRSLPKEFSHIQYVVDALRQPDSTVQAAMVDSTEWNYFELMYGGYTELDIKHEYRYPSYYGLLLSADSHAWSHELIKCFTSYALRQEREMHENLTAQLKALRYNVDNNPVDPCMPVTSEVTNRKTKNVLSQVFTVSNEFHLAATIAACAFVALVIMTSGIQSVWFKHKQRPMRDMFCYWTSDDCKNNGSTRRHSNVSAETCLSDLEDKPQDTTR